MLEFEPLTLDKKDAFDAYIRGHGYMQSEASFANLYIWQHAWEIQMAEAEGALFLSFNSDVYRPFLMPPFQKDDSLPIAPLLRMEEEYMQRKYGEFYVKCATSDVVEKIRRECADRYTFRYDEANCDYVYKAENLRDLSGKRYHGKRNHINGFLRDYFPTVADYTPAYRDGCLLVQDAWARMRDGSEREAEEEYISIMKALDNYEALGLRGIVVLLEGQVAAFSLGELLTDDTALIHIEKARPDVNGLFTYVNQQFVQRAWSDCAYINREEDMGMPGIRQAKRSYHPEFLVDKFDVIRREERR